MAMAVDPHSSSVMTDDETNNEIPVLRTHTDQQFDVASQASNKKPFEMTDDEIKKEISVHQLILTKNLMLPLFLPSSQTFSTLLPLLLTIFFGVLNSYTWRSRVKESSQQASFHHYVHSRNFPTRYALDKNKLYDAFIFESI
ncbi:hypothetical protein ACB092_05G025000 [Castanea dentata]